MEQIGLQVAALNTGRPKSGGSGIGLQTAALLAGGASPNTLYKLM